MQGDATSDDDRPERAITSEQGLEQTEPPVAAVRGLPESLAVSLRENRTAWYRELQQLARMEKCIRDQLKVASKDALGNGDPVIVAAGKRDLLDALRRGAALTDSVLRGSSHTPRAVPSEAAKGTLAPILKGFSDTLKRLWPSDGADAARAEPTSPPSSLVIIGGHQPQEELLAGARARGARGGRGRAGRRRQGLRRRNASSASTASESRAP
ncbi:unnamed protein product [Prorocentrum cordatum]|uniref:Uncharacterized protein n=1 Tax=Prorocentrum cordatum TaxID=2364126 RepID=A0ABN9XD87_9DINO|nr:unnamed protein product [Polarella glacialis]